MAFIHHSAEGLVMDHMFLQKLVTFFLYLYIDMFDADSLTNRYGKASYVTESVYQNYVNIHV